MRNADSMAVSAQKPKAMIKLTEPNVAEINKDLYPNEEVARGSIGSLSGPDPRPRLG
jgi:hypothetical protein